MSDTIDVSVLIVSYNTQKLTLACLESVYEQTTTASFEVLVIDNASSDGSANAIRNAFPQVRLLEPGSNQGFASANNLAAKHATGEFILLLNPDTVILDKAIDRIVAFARQRPGAGVYGGRTFFGDGSLNYTSCHGRPTPWSLFCMGLGLSSLFRRWELLNPEGLGAWKRDSIRTVDCVTGCFLLIRRDLWQRLGGFDLDFFMYGEDTDLSIRAAAAAGPNLVFPDARLIHYGGQSEAVRADKMVRLFRAKRQLLEKHWSPLLVPYGRLMLKLWAGTRALAHTLLNIIGKKDDKARQTWCDIWRRRREYAGHP